MELIQDLPEVFEEFAEQRKNSFLAVKKLKEKGIPVVGAYCTYFPQEIAMAAGAATVGLCSTSDETIQEAEKDLPKNLCPLIKSSYGFAKADKCPFFYFQMWSWERRPVTARRKCMNICPILRMCLSWSCRIHRAKRH